MTSAEINALPPRLRDYIRDLECACDPAGIIRDNSILTETLRGVSVLIEEQSKLIAEQQKELAKSKREDRKHARLNAVAAGLLACPTGDKNETRIALAAAGYAYALDNASY